MSPIGRFFCDKKFPYDAARQPHADAIQSTGYVELFSGKNFEQALQGLDLFSHIWLIFQFDRNADWKPMVLPPRGSTSKVGVFATRSPYRPVPIGMSNVRLVRITGRQIHVQGHDLLDQTPILDIKPYVPEADIVKEANSGWLRNTEAKFTIEISSACLAQIAFLETHGLTSLRPFLIQQLEYEPLNSSKKRVRSEGARHCLAYRTWRCHFRLLHEARILVEYLTSGYTPDELHGTLSHEQDPYGDKVLHQLFLKTFPAAV